MKLRKHEDTGWERLSEDDSIYGRIVDGIATIRIVAYNLTINAAGNPYQILALPDRYVPTRSIPFSLTRELANPEVVSGIVINDAPARIRVYSKNTGKFALYGSVSYPVK